MLNIAGRINSANITNQEWTVLLKVYNLAADFRNGWYTPSPQDWLQVRGLLGVLEIRRGYEIDKEGTLQLGVAQIRLNEHGFKACWHMLKGETYVSGKRMGNEDIAKMLIADGLDPKALFPDGFYFGEDGDDE
jgi:hypothetical protein